MIALRVSMSRLASRCLLALSVMTGAGAAWAGAQVEEPLADSGALGPVCCGGPGRAARWCLPMTRSARECERWSRANEARLFKRKPDELVRTSF